MQIRIAASCQKPCTSYSKNLRINSDTYLPTYLLSIGGKLLNAVYCLKWRAYFLSHKGTIGNQSEYLLDPEILVDTL